MCRLRWSWINSSLMWVEIAETMILVYTQQACNSNTTSHWRRYDILVVASASVRRILTRWVECKRTLLRTYTCILLNSNIGTSYMNKPVLIWIFMNYIFYTLYPHCLFTFREFAPNKSVKSLSDYIVLFFIAMYESKSRWILRNGAASWQRVMQRLPLAVGTMDPIILFLSNIPVECDRFT